MGRSSEVSNDPDVLGEVVKFLDLAAEARAVADYYVEGWVAFVWGQRRDHILAGEETFEDQNPPKALMFRQSPESI